MTLTQDLCSCNRILTCAGIGCSFLSFSNCSAALYVQKRKWEVESSWVTSSCYCIFRRPFRLAGVTFGEDICYHHSSSPPRELQLRWFVIRWFREEPQGRTAWNIQVSSILSSLYSFLSIREHTVSCGSPAAQSSNFHVHTKSLRGLCIFPSLEQVCATFFPWNRSSNVFCLNMTKAFKTI